MDRKLFEAACTGNIENLQKLIEDDPCLLGVVSLSGGETPLHIACLAGHLNFVKQVVKLNQEFARELNQDGLSPLHIASANGYLEIVKELLKVDCNLCLINGRERKIPLHFAAIKGRVHILRELLSASADSVEDVTARRETALHLAVKNNQFNAFKVLLEHLKEFNKEDVLNMKDSQGNTILHLAVSSKQYQVIELLLNEHIVAKSLVEVNSLNGSGLTPLDVLLLFQSEAGDREIEETLTRAGATKARDLYSLAQPEDTQNHVFVVTNNSPNAQSTTEQSRSPSNQLLEYFKYDQINDSPSKVRNTLLVIAILIVTATYQAVLSPPGGVWQDDIKSNDNNNGTNSTKPHTAGRTIMGSHNPIAYGLFLLFNSIGFFTSLYMINILTLGFPLRFELQVSSVALIVTYDTCMTATAPNTTISFFFTGISIVLPLVFPVISIVVRNYVRRLCGVLPCTNQASV